VFIDLILCLWERRISGGGEEEDDIDPKQHRDDDDIDFEGRGEGVRRILSFILLKVAGQVAGLDWTSAAVV
jgi:hypothetical protein